MELTKSTRQNGRFDIRKFHEKVLESGVIPLVWKKRLTLGSQRNKMTSNYSYKKAFAAAEAFV
jgi:hypothetical protein